jgi:hypothetical protein
MLNSIPKLNNAAGKLGDWADRFNAAKSALLNKADEDELDFDFSTNRLNNEPRRNEVEAADIDFQDEVMGRLKKEEHTYAGTEIEDRTAFLNNRVKEKILAKWEVQGENGPNDDFIEEIMPEDYDGEEVKSAPFLMGFDRNTDYVELEYTSVADPQTGQSVAPVVKILASDDMATDNVFLNGKLVASVARGQNIDATDVLLVKVEA